MFSVLLVEDEPLIREILVEELRSAGFTVCEAASADDAAELIDRRPQFSLLLTDIHMPGRMDGLALGRLMRSRFPELPVVYITGRPDVLGRLGSNEVLVHKPFTPPDILETIQRLLFRPPEPGRAAT